MAMIKKNDITNSKIRPIWQALIILNYGDISTYYFEWNNVLMSLLRVFDGRQRDPEEEGESTARHTLW